MGISLGLGANPWTELQRHPIPVKLSISNTSFSFYFQTIYGSFWFFAIGIFRLGLASTCRPFQSHCRFQVLILPFFVVEHLLPVLYVFDFEDSVFLVFQRIPRKKDLIRWSRSIRTDCQVVRFLSCIAAETPFFLVSFLFHLLWIRVLWKQDSDNIFWDVGSL